MTAIVVNDFKGMLPRRSPRLLQQNFAVEASNVEITGGQLRGYRNLELIKTLSAPAEAVYRIPQDDPDPDLFLEFDDVNVDVVRSPLVNDAFDRYYYTIPTDQPQYTTLDRIIADQPTFDLGVVRPDQALTVTPSDIVSATLVDVAYTYAYVTSFGEIGPAADPTIATGTEITDTNGVSWLLENIQTVPPGGFNTDITHINIYRTITSATGVATYFFVAQITVATNTFNDTIPTTDISLNEQYDGFDWTPPPAGLQGLITMPNGFLVGFVDNDVWFSEPFLPHAWPVEYVLSTEYPIVGLGVFGNIVFALTTSAPSLIMGTRPENMSMTKAAGIEPCLSKRSIITSTQGVYYASQNGLILATQSGVNITTRYVITRDQWRRDFNPQDIRAARLGTKYMAIEETGIGFILDPEDQQELGSISNLDQIPPVENVQTDPWTGEVLLVADDEVFVWDSLTQDRQAFTWKSKLFQIPRPLNFAVGMIHFEGAPTVALKVWANDVLKFDRTVTDREQFRLPSGFKADLWQFEVATDGEIHSVALAETGQELAGV